MAGGNGEADREMMTLREVAERLRVSRTTVVRMVAAGHLTGYQLPGGVWRFERKELEAFIVTLKVVNPPAAAEEEEHGG
jgi:excisionase family DNA binding protein